MGAELALSTINERRLGRLGEPLRKGRAARIFKAAKVGVRAGLALRALRGRGPAVHHVVSALYLASGLAFRIAWVDAGRESGRDDDAVAQMARDGASR
jgi:hypothetical protein